MNALPVPSLSWKQIAIAMAAWLVGCVGVGFAIAAFIGEHGSIVWAILGFAIGLSGAMAHSALLFLASFRSQSHLRQAIILWLATVFALVALVLVYQALSSEKAPTHSVKEICLFFSIYVAAPTLLAAAVFSYVVGTRSAA